MEKEKLEYFVLVTLKNMWDQGMRSKSSSTGKYFKSSDVTGDANIFNAARVLNGRMRDENSMALGRCLSKLSGLTFSYKGKKHYLDKYVVDGGSVYRFVEL